MDLPRDPVVAFEQPDDRYDAMHQTIETWVDDLADLVTRARSSDEFQAWLNVQSRFHDYSYRNTLLILQQRPDATHVAGYRTWQTEFDRHVKEGEQAIWIWAPIIARRCPECKNTASYHETTDCTYDEIPPEEWSRGLVGFKPAPVFDVSQTHGKPLPSIDTAATGDARHLVPALLDAAAEFALDARIVPAEEWSHGAAMGVCTRRNPMSARPLVEAKARENHADLATTLIHEYAHAQLHFDVAPDERAKREVEAEAVAYIVGRHFDLDTSNSAFYVAAWEDDDSVTLHDRLDRISTVAQEFIETIDQSMRQSE